ncbi:MAG: hypothetical protein HQK86_05365 [Nitrospinae bacterium]|nr:hypothetical protein [Nitrospinota bacterium]
MAFCVLSLAILCSPASSEAADVESGEVYSLAQSVLGDIELIRIEMGIPRTSPIPIKVKGVSPWESFHQAKLLYEKTNLLAFEFTRHMAQDIPAHTAANISNADTLRILQLAHERVIETKKALGISESAKASDAGSVTGDDVFMTLIMADRIAHQCLRTPVAPVLSFQRVTTAVSYASSLLGAFPDPHSVIPSLPPFERGKIPGDTFIRLSRCQSLIEQIASKSGVKVMKLDISAVERENIVPSDTQSIAAMVISELSYLHSLQKQAKPVRQAIDPGRKFPSHVYQRTGILEAQLSDLLQKASKSPRWLEGEFNR